MQTETHPFSSLLDEVVRPEDFVFPEAPPEEVAPEVVVPAKKLASPLMDPAMRDLHQRLTPRSDCWWG